MCMENKCAYAAQNVAIVNILWLDIPIYLSPMSFVQSNNYSVFKHGLNMVITDALCNDEIF